MKITKDHLKLLKKAYWIFDEREYGAPAIDPKRPYVNSNVEDDIAEILGWKLFVNKYGEEELSLEQSEKAYKLHHELIDVIQQIIKEYEIKNE